MPLDKKVEIEKWATRREAGLSATARFWLAKRHSRQAY